MIYFFSVKLQPNSLKLFPKIMAYVEMPYDLHVTQPVVIEVSVLRAVKMMGWETCAPPVVTTVLSAVIISRKKVNT